MKQIKNLLIIRQSALGDVCMTIPVIYQLAEQHPELTIKVLTRKRFRGLFFSCPPNVQMIEADPDLYRKSYQLFSLFRILRKEQIDAVADFHGVLRSYVLDALFRTKGIPVAILQKNRSQRKALTRRHNKVKQAQTSFFVRYAQALQQLGLSVDLKAPNRYLPVVPKTVDANIKSIGIAPFARYFTKIYPLEQMAEVVRLLAEENYLVYLFGNGKQEMAQMAEMAAGLSQVHIVSDKLSFEEQLQLMSGLHVMISMDSANMHLASLVHTPVLSIWGGTSPHCGFMGWNQSTDNALCKDLRCQPCSISGTDKCPLAHFHCMRKIKPTEIISKIKEITK